ncbi:unnamed protein product [Moneuplotes crassus]|uniref:USP domain-containing protein n=1 Tax=Euplotes crassus TaxID=5936 RepID=A0AAD1XC99_EUPCR|nr:unnamed protein product [Moneuplotes crassus]
MPEEEKNPVVKGAAIGGAAAMGTGATLAAGGTAVAVGLEVEAAVVVGAACVGVAGVAILVGGAAVLGGVGVYKLVKNINKRRKNQKIQHNREAEEIQRRQAREKIKELFLPSQPIGDDDTPSPEEDFLLEADHERQVAPSITVGHNIISNPVLDCFMGAALQSLMSLPDFVDYFIHSRNSSDFKEENKQESLIVEMMKGFVKDYAYSQDQEIDAQVLRYAFDQDFPSDKEHDAFEFLLELFDKIRVAKNSENIHDHLQRCIDRNGNLKRCQKLHSSIIDKLFSGITETMYKCQVCSQATYLYQEFLYIPLRYDPGNPRAGFEEFFDLEEKTHESFWRCENCERETKWLLREETFKFPKYLIFKFESNCSSEENEIKSPVDYPKSFTKEDPFSESKLKYTLTSTIIHEQGSSCGHYSSICLRENQWFHLTPHSSKALENREIKSPDAYILFYTAEEII